MERLVLLDQQRRDVPGRDGDPHAAVQRVQLRRGHPGLVVQRQRQRAQPRPDAPWYPGGSGASSSARRSASSISP